METPTSTQKVFNLKSKTIRANGIRMNFVQMGEPTHGTILFLHGYPEFWYTWRHQLVSLSSAGYRTVAPDLRGFGDSDVPPSAANYTIFHVIGDLVALLDYLVVEKVFLVGHDWGAIIAWHFTLIRPDRIKALLNLSVPFMPRDPDQKPTEKFREAFGENFYICRYQKPGDMEDEYRQIDTKQLLKRCLTLKDSRPPIIPKGALRIATFLRIHLPLWLSDYDLEGYTDAFKKTGFTGGLNHYRNMDLNWELMAPWTGAQIKVPVKFIIGDEDITYNFPGMKDYIHKGGFKKDVPLLEDVIVMEGVGHFINQEKSQEINKYIHHFFHKF